jgi:hypothetical protein
VCAALFGLREQEIRYLAPSDEMERAIRAGRPIMVAAETIIDWAIWIDGMGIVEGGQTNVIAQGHASQG